MKYCIQEYKINSIEYGNFKKNVETRFNLKRTLTKYELSLQDYELLFNYFEYSELKDYTYIYPEPSKPLTCIFCLKQEPAVTFNNRSHVIPYSLGNKYLLHYEECDSCNAYFSSTLEDVLDKYTSVFRTLNRMKNRRNQVPKITSIDGNFTYTFDKKDNVYQISGENYKDFINDDNNGNLTISFDIKRHRPSDVYKAFMKIFYGLLPPEHRKKFTILREWIMEKDPCKLMAKPTIIIRSFLSGFNNKPLVISIISKKILTNENSRCFDYMGLIAFGNVVYEMPIISDEFLNFANKLKENGEPLNFELKLLPKPIEPIVTEPIDLSDTNFITDKFKINFTYTDRSENN